MVVLMLAHVVTLHSLILLSCPRSPSQLLDCCVIPLTANSDHNGLKLRVNWKLSQVHHYFDIARTQKQYGNMLMLTSTKLEI